MTLDLRPRPTRPPALGRGISALCLLFLLIGLAGRASAQVFGQNKVQYEKFAWQVLETEHFQVHFYPAEEEAVKDAARMAERSYAKLSKLLGHEIKNKVPLLLYASHTDFQQTNALQGLIEEGTGGVTEFLKRRVILPFTGSYAELDHVLTHELVHAFQVDILMGPGKSPLSGRFNSPPLWMMEGMAEYLSIGKVDEHTSMWLRDAALEGYLISLEDLEYTGDIRVYRFGQAIFEFIDQQYGTQKIGELLKAFARRGSLDRAVQGTLGMSVTDLSKAWVAKVRKENLPQIAEFEPAESYGLRLTNQEKDLSRLNLSPAVSPDGKLMVFLSDRSLYNDMYLASAIDGKVQTKLVEGERSGGFESLRFLQAAFAWSPDQKFLAFAAKVGGEDAVYLFNVEKKKAIERLTFGLDGIQSPSFSPDGKQVVFVGQEGGQSDLFITSLDGKEVRRLTQDRFTDRDPQWSPDGRTIAFTTDRGPRTNFRTLEFGEFRIGLYDLSTDQIRILPGQEGKNINPQWSPDGTKLAFISDRIGISNIYMMDVATAEAFQLTNVLTGITGIVEASPAMSWSRDGSRMVFSVFERGGWNIYGIKDPLDLLEEQEGTEEKVIAEAASGPKLPRRLGGGEILEDGDMQIGGGRTMQAGDDPTGEEIEANSPASGRVEPAEAQGSADSAAVGGTDRSEAQAVGEGETEVTTEAVGENAGENAGEAQVGEDEVDRAGSDETGASEAAIFPAPDDSLGAGELSSPRPVGEAGMVDGPAEAPAAGDKSTLKEGEEGPEVAADGEEEVEEEEIQVTYRPPAPDGSTFKVKDYRVKFSPDVLAGVGGVAPGVGVAGQFALGFSDVLGNHRIQVLANFVSSISESDLFLTYLNLERHNNWGVSVFQYRNDYLSFRDSAFLRTAHERYRGAEVFMSHPFSRFRRVEAGLEGSFVDRSGFEGSEISGTGVDINADRFFFVKPSVALVTDNVLFGSVGPIAGRRTRLSLSHALGDLSYTTVGLDTRSYVNFRQRYTLGWRFIGVTSFGETPQITLVGGPWTVRGYGFEQFGGYNVGIMNTEFRFPLIDQFRLGGPLPFEYRGVRGAVFFDAGTAFDRYDSLQPFTTEGKGLVRTEDLFASYGFGVRLNLGFLLMRYDAAQKTDLTENIGQMHHTVILGGEF
jgi:Tol biopolymer transport system component